jgi:hypothetical protein
MKPVTCTGMVGLGRLELPTSRLSGVRSNHLSYKPELPMLIKLINNLGVRKRNEGGNVPLSAGEGPKSYPAMFQVILKILLSCEQDRLSGQDQSLERR